MIVRLRLQTGPQIRRATGKNRHVASAISALIWPAVLTTYVLGFWALAAQIQIARPFSVATGAFSHWQVWLAAGFLLHLAAVGLNHYGQNGNFRFPEWLSWLSQFRVRRASE